jgi:hypothetical protein
MKKPRNYIKNLGSFAHPKGASRPAKIGVVKRPRIRKPKVK